MKSFTCFSTAFLVAVFFLSGCSTTNATLHENGAVEQQRKQATKDQTTTTATLGAAAICGVIANKATSKENRKKATILAAGICGGAAYSATSSGYQNEMLDRLENHLKTIAKPGVEISRGGKGDIVSIVFKNRYANIPGNSLVVVQVRSDINFIAQTMKLFPSVNALIATADPNDRDFKGVGYRRAHNWSKLLIKNGAPGNHIKYTSLANSPLGAITQIDFTVSS